MRVDSSLAGRPAGPLEARVVADADAGALDAPEAWSAAVELSESSAAATAGAAVKDSPSRNAAAAARAPCLTTKIRVPPPPHDGVESLNPKTYRGREHTVNITTPGVR